MLLLVACRAADLRLPEPSSGPCPMGTNLHRACRPGWAWLMSTRRHCGCCCWHTAPACCWCMPTIGSAVRRHSMAGRRRSKQQGRSRLMWQRVSSAGPAASMALSAPRPLATLEGGPGPLKRQRQLSRPGSTPPCKSRQLSLCWGQGLARQQAQHWMLAPQACGSPSAWRRSRSGSGTTACATGFFASSWTRCWSAWWRCVSGGAGPREGWRRCGRYALLPACVCLYW